MKNLFLILFCLFYLFSEFAEAQKSWIFFRDKKKIGAYNPNLQELGITERALKRRAKSLPTERLIDEFDYPVSQSLINQIEQTGARIKNVSRWLNAVTVEATPSQLQSIKMIQDVVKTEPVAILKRTPLQPQYTETVRSIEKQSISTELNYGYSETQLKNIKITDLHSIGVNGNGVLICLIDDGFNNYRIHNALKNIDVVATYDFIHNIEDVNRQPYEISIQGNHGQGVLSSIGGFENGKLIGAAYGASFLLAKTEMDSSGNTDFHSEEDTYVAALEWAERLGADISSSSLGYKDFTPPLYTTSDLNGRTTKVAKAATIAARKGVLVVTAMGNDGYIYGVGNQMRRKDTTLVSLADADSIIAVGATSSDGWLATFSGTGPTADGRIKPEVVAQGMGVYWASGTSSYGSVNGTSAATPLVAGAAALVLSAHPQLTNMQVRDAIMQNAVRLSREPFETASYPNNYYGWGFLDAHKTALSLGPVFSNAPEVKAEETNLIISIKIVSNTGIRSNSVFLHFTDGITNYTTSLFPTANANEYQCNIPRFNADVKITGYFEMEDDSGRYYRFPPNSQNKLRIDTFLSITPTLPQQYKFYQNYPNPFNAETKLRFEFPRNEEAELIVHNILGQRIKTLFRGNALGGMNTKTWDGKDESGKYVASGVYFARLKTRDKIYIIKMLFLR